MKVYGFEAREQSLQHIAALSGVKLENMRKEGRAWTFRVVADGCSRRRSAGWGDRQGRLTRSPSFWPMAVFIGRLFWFGAARVQTGGPGRGGWDWRTFAAFDAGLRATAECNVGSWAYPCCFGDLEAVPGDEDIQERYIKLASAHLDGYSSAIYL